MTLCHQHHANIDGTSNCPTQTDGWARGAAGDEIPTTLPPPHTHTHHRHHHETHTPLAQSAPTPFHPDTHLHEGHCDFELDHPSRCPDEVEIGPGTSLFHVPRPGCGTELLPEELVQREPGRRNRRSREASTPTCGCRQDTVQRHTQEVPRNATPPNATQRYAVPSPKPILCLGIPCALVKLME